MKKTILFLLVTAIVFTASGQENIVLNPSFEDRDTCPHVISEIRHASEWGALDTNVYTPLNDSIFYVALGSAEFYHACAPWWTNVSVPQNAYYYHYARTGNGMVGFYVYYYGAYQGPTYKRDYVHGHLAHPLTAGQSYCVSYYVASAPVNGFAANHLGAYLDDGSILIGQDSASSAQPQTQITPQVVTNTILWDTVHWMKVEGSFIATGNEDEITIGNFSSDAQTDIIAMCDTTGFWNSGQGSWSYYLLDDISVVPSNLPAYAGNDTTINEGDSVYIGRNEILPGIKWQVGNTVIDSVNAGIWVKPTQSTTYVLVQSLCGNVTFDTVTISVLEDTTVDTTVVVPYVSYKAGFTIYPNPSNGEFKIVSKSLSNQQVHMNIYDVSGRLVAKQPVMFTKTEVSVELNVAPGLYLVELMNHSGGKYIQQLIIK